MANQSEIQPFVRCEYFGGAHASPPPTPHGTRTNTTDAAGLYHDVQADYIGVQGQINF